MLYRSKLLVKAFTRRHHFRHASRLFYNLLLCPQCIFSQHTRLLLLQNNGQVLFFFFLCASLKEPSSGLPLKRTRAPHSHVLTVRQLQHFTITGSEHLWTNNNTNQNKIDAAAQMRWSVVLRSERTQEDPQFHASSSHYDYYTNIHTITIRKPPFLCKWPSCES